MNFLKQQLFDRLKNEGNFWSYEWFCRINKLDIFSIANTSFYAAKLLNICQLDIPYP